MTNFAAIFRPFTLPDPTDGTVYVFGPRSTDGAMDLMKKLSLNIPELVAKSPTRSSVDNSLCTGKGRTMLQVALLACCAAGFRLLAP